ncbi:ATP-binding protein [Amycolatopsis orientalis]|uniref:ATP-binding protein n=1 Tax=Amycolatopsis orientalis TaxID=31958 RepID=UPI00040E429F|nr:ATP-binding protein [Amycolatopsis orientalis]
MVEVVILIGLQASGKTTFFHREFASTHVHLSKDNFRHARRPQARQLRILTEALEDGRSVVVDNTNPSPEEWVPLIEVARRHGAKVAGYWFPPDLAGSHRRNALRTGKTRVPDVGLYATLKRLRRPGAEDGFDELYTVGFDGAGGFVVERG